MEFINDTAHIIILWMIYEFIKVKTYTCSTRNKNIKSPFSR